MKKGQGLEKKFATYIYKTPKQRMSIMLANYRGFELMWTKLFNELVYAVCEQKECNRRSSAGDIGVRVQTSHAASSPTEDRAIRIMEVEALIEDCDFGGGLLRDVDDPEEVKDKVLALRVMKNEFEMLSMEIDCLPEDDREVLLMDIYDRMSHEEIAREKLIEPESLTKKIWRIKKSLLEGMLPAMSGVAC